MTQEQWINKTATGMALTFGISPAKCKLFLSGVARAGNVFRFSGKPYPSEAQIEWLVDIQEKAGAIFKNQEEMRRIKSPDGKEELIILPMKRIDDLARAFANEKEKQFVENHIKQSKLLVTP